MTSGSEVLELELLLKFGRCLVGLELLLPNPDKARPSIFSCSVNTTSVSNDRDLAADLDLVLNLGAFV